MSAVDSVVAPDVVAAARELIRNEADACIVSIFHKALPSIDRFIDHLFDATEGIDALREIDWDEEEADR
jgi:hypothetical protein